MNNAERNIKVVAENNENKQGFNIYLDCSGKREFIVWHRHNEVLYNILKDGVALRDINRRKPKPYEEYRALTKGDIQLLLNMGRRVSDEPISEIFTDEEHFPDSSQKKYSPSVPKSKQMNDIDASYEMPFQPTFLEDWYKYKKKHAKAG